MKKVLRKLISVFLVLTLTVSPALPLTQDLFALIGSAIALAESKPLPEVFSLDASALGAETQSGPWRYAFRESDGYALITGYDGETDGSLSVPEKLDDARVVGLADHALKGIPLRDLFLHGNIFYIGNEAFDGTPVIHAPNGTYPLYYADRNHLRYTTDTDYTLVPGVIDFSGAAKGAIKRRGDQYVWFRMPEGLALREGSVFYMKDARGTSFFLRVTGLCEADGGILASVTSSDISETFVNMKTTERIVFTADDFIPAEGVTVGPTSSAGKDGIASSSDEKGIPLSITPMDYKKSKDLGKSSSASLDISLIGSYSNAVEYTVEIRNGKIVDLKETEERHFEITLSLSGGISTDFINDNEQKKKDDHYDYKIAEPKNKERKFEHKLGKIIFNNGFLSVDVTVGFGFSVTGEVSGSFVHTETEKKHYDFANDTWIVDTADGNAKKDNNSFSAGTEVTGKFFISVTATIGFASIIRVLEVNIEAGVKLEASTSSALDTAVHPCTKIKLDLYLSIHIDIGIWFSGSKNTGDGKKSKTFGFQAALLDRTLSLARGLDIDNELHINPFVEPHCHWSKECPLDDMLTVSFDTRTGDLIDPIEILPGETVPDRDAFHPKGTKQTGEFLGWADQAGADAANWVLGEGGNVVSEDTTLYAIWEKTVAVTFNSDGGSSVPTQRIPADGYATEPAEPVKEGCHLRYWYTLDGNGQPDMWDFSVNTVPAGGVTLYARWDQGEPRHGGTKACMYIGDRREINLSDYADLQNGRLHLTYDVYYSPEGDPIGLGITGVKGNPVNLVIPGEMFVPANLESGEGAEILKYLKVIDIKAGAFSGNTTLKSVFFHTAEGIYHDLSDMFAGCANLEYVDLSMAGIYNGTVGRSAFKDCAALKCVKLPAGIDSIGESAFEGCTGLRQASFPDEIVSIGESAFEGCTGLTDLDLGEGIRNIGISAFRGCSGLTELYLPDSLRTVEVPKSYYYGAFYGCTGLKNISIGGLEAIQPDQFVFGGENSPFAPETLEIRGSVKFIYAEAFRNEYPTYKGFNNAAASMMLIIRDGVQSIGDYAFGNCLALTEVELPGSLTSFGINTFEGCERIRDVRFSEDLSLIGEGAFMNCSGLESITIPNNCKTIRKNAFYGCSGMTVLDLGTGVETIQENAFRDCTGLKELFLPDSLRSVAIPSNTSGGSFYRCTGLEKVSIGGIENIYPKMFVFGGEKLKELEIRGTVKNICANAFNSSQGLSAGSEVWYHGFHTTATAAKLIIREGVTSIGDGAFKGCAVFTDVELPDTLTDICANAFSDCSRLKEISIPGSCVLIGDSAFANCGALETLSFRPGAKGIVIGQTAFAYCQKLSELSLPERKVTLSSHTTYNNKSPFY